MKLNSLLKSLFFLTIYSALARADEPQLDHAFGPSPFSSQSLAFSPDAKKLAVVGSDGLKIYETATGKVLETRPGSSWHTSSVAWSPDGKKLAVGGLMFDTLPHGEITLWREGQKTLRWQTGRADIASLVFSPDNHLLASASGRDAVFESTRGAARLWDAESGQLKRTLRSYVANEAFIAFSPSGKRILLSYDDIDEESSAIAFDSKTGRTIQTYKGDYFPAKWTKDELPLRQLNAPLAHAEHGNYEMRVAPVIGADHLSLRFVVTKQGQRQAARVQELDENGGGEVVFGGAYLAAVTFRRYFPGEESLVKIWKIEGTPPRATLIRTLGNRTLAPRQLISSGDGKTLAVAVKRATLLLSSEEQIKVRRVIPDSLWPAFFPALSLSSDGTQLFNGSWLDLGHDAAITPRTRFKPEQLTTTNKVAAFAPDGTRLASENQIQLSNGKIIPLKVLDEGEENGQRDVEAPLSLAWSPDGEHLAYVSGSIGGSSSYDGLYLFFKTGRFIQQIRRPDVYTKVCAAAWSPNGKILATAVSDNMPTQSVRSRLRLELWDTSNFHFLREINLDLKNQLSFGRGLFTSLAFSPDSNALATSGIGLEDGAMKSRLLVFDTTSGQKLGSLPLELPFNTPQSPNWAWLGNSQIAILHGNALETWDWRAHKLQACQWLVPDGKGVRLVDAPIS